MIWTLFKAQTNFILMERNLRGVEEEKKISLYISRFMAETLCNKRQINEKNEQNVVTCAGFLGGAVVKKSTCQAGDERDTGSIP